MTLVLTSEAWLIALLILVLRVVDLVLNTIRLLYVAREHRFLVWILGFCQALIFIVVLMSVLTGSAGLLGILAYAAGYASGSVVGMWIEERLMVGFVRLTVVSSRLGAALAEALRQHGYAVTELSGRGKDGTVTVLNISVRRRQVNTVETVILETDPDAFITAEDVRTVRRGFWRV